MPYGNPLGYLDPMERERRRQQQMMALMGPQFPPPQDIGQGQSAPMTYGKPDPFAGIPPVQLPESLQPKDPFAGFKRPPLQLPAGLQQQATQQAPAPQQPTPPQVAPQQPPPVASANRLLAPDYDPREVVRQRLEEIRGGGGTAQLDDQGFLRRPEDFGGPMPQRGYTMGFDLPQPAQSIPGNQATGIRSVRNNIGQSALAQELAKEAAMTPEERNLRALERGYEQVGDPDDNMFVKKGRSRTVAIKNPDGTVTLIGDKTIPPKFDEWTTEQREKWLDAQRRKPMSQERVQELLERKKRMQNKLKKRRQAKAAENVAKKKMLGQAGMGGEPANAVEAGLGAAEKLDQLMRQKFGRPATPQEKENAVKTGMAEYEMEQKFKQQEKLQKQKSQGFENRHVAEFLTQFAPALVLGPNKEFLSEEEIAERVQSAGPLMNALLGMMTGGRFGGLQGFNLPTGGGQGGGGPKPDRKQVQQAQAVVSEVGDPIEAREKLITEGYPAEVIDKVLEGKKENLTPAQRKRTESELKKKREREKRNAPLTRSYQLYGPTDPSDAGSVAGRRRFPLPREGDPPPEPWLPPVLRNKK